MKGVVWKRYEYVETSKTGPDGKEQKKIALVQKKTPPKELFDYLIQLLGPYPYHSFLANWQKEQFDNLIEHLPVNHAVCVHDYSENYACRYQNEIQSQYFDMGKVSLHVTILYRPVSPLDGAEVDGGADVPIDEGGTDVSVSVGEAHGFQGTDHRGCSGSW